MNQLVFGNGAFSLGGRSPSIRFGGGSLAASIVLSALTIAENSAAGTSIGTLSVSNAPDGVTYTYEVTTDASGFFETSTATLQTASGVDLDYEVATSYVIEVTATGSDASTIVQEFTLSVTDVGSSPIVLSFDTPVEVADDAAEADVVATFSASSADSSDTFTYSLQADASGNFEIVGDELRVATGASLVVDATHSVTVRVTVDDGSYAEETFDVGVVAGGPILALASAADFNGSTDYMKRTADLVGNADGSQLTFATWLYLGSGIHEPFRLGSTSIGTGLYFRFDNGRMLLNAYNASDSAIMQVSPAPGSYPAYQNTWVWVGISFDLTNASNRHFYIDDTALSVTWSPYANATMDLTRAASGVGTYDGSNALLTGKLAHLFFDNSYIDFSVEANRRLFQDGAGAPVEGLQTLSPLAYLPMTDASNRGKNWGDGGDYTVVGTP